MGQDIGTLRGNGSLLTKVQAGQDLLGNITLDVMMLGPFGGEADATRAETDAAGGDGELARGAAHVDPIHGDPFSLGDDGLGATVDAGCHSFGGDTPVATPQGERPIAQLQVGDPVKAYDPTTGHAEAEPVQRVWLNHDSDLVDVRLVSSADGTGQADSTQAATATAASAGGHGLLVGDDAASAVHLTVRRAADADAGETVHTTANHPWLTADRGWVGAGDLRPGERVVTLGSGTSTVAWVHVVPGQADMYNLTVVHDHTYGVGDGQ